MAVSYKRLLHVMIERNISNAQLMRAANISTIKRTIYGTW